jgi:hypothetical protein
VELLIGQELEAEALWALVRFVGASTTEPTAAEDERGSGSESKRGQVPPGSPLPPPTLVAKARKAFFQLNGRWVSELPDGRDERALDRAAVDMLGCLAWLEYLSSGIHRAAAVYEAALTRYVLMVYPL